MNPHYTYLVILACSFLGPFILSFDKKVAFYTKWKYLFPALLFPAMFYIIWDSYFTSLAVWSFNERYITGIYLGNLPLEEVLFFFVVPYCCLFIYECIRCYFPGIKNSQAANVALKVLAALLLITGAFFYHKSYTAYSFVLFAFFVGLYYQFKNRSSSFNAGLFLVAYGVILIPFLLVNGFLTAIPVVLYNDAENLGIRLYTIPVEDSIYGMLLVFMNVIIFEKLRSKY